MNANINILIKYAKIFLVTQREKLNHVFDEYRGENDIQDDLTVVGFGF